MNDNKLALKFTFHEDVYEYLNPEDLEELPENLDQYSDHICSLMERDLSEEPKSLEYLCDALSGIKEISLSQKEVSTEKSIPLHELMLIEIAATFESYYTDESLDFTDKAIKNLKLLLKTLERKNTKKSLRARAQLISELSIYRVARAIEITGTPPKLNPKFNK